MLLHTIRQLFSRSVPITEPEAAYNLWAASYDRQPENLMLALDEEIFSGLLKQVSPLDARILDIGCGTGRHWYRLLETRPARLVGYDVSIGMLRILREKFPNQEVCRLVDQKINEQDESFDLVISTLTIAHIRNAESAISEWCRLLKPGGYLIITDFHPEALRRGGERTFTHEGNLVSVRNHVHPVQTIIAIAKRFKVFQETLVEQRIDEKLRGWYEAKNAMSVYEKFKGSPIIYGCLLKKSDAAS